MFNVFLSELPVDQHSRVEAVYDACALFESVVTNTVYYGIAFVLYLTNVWTPTLTGIALLFGIGNAFDSIVSPVAYAFLLKKEKINLLHVE